MAKMKRTATKKKGARVAGSARTSKGSGAKRSLKRKAAPAKARAPRKAARGKPKAPSKGAKSRTKARTASQGARKAKTQAIKRPRAKAKVAPKARTTVTKAARPAKPAGALKTAIRAGTDAEDLDVMASKTTNPKHHRLAPSSRHAVETDEPREEAGQAGRAFVDTDTQEDEAKELGEEFVRSATSGEEAESEMEEEETEEEQGGPFVVTSARTEYGREPDESNPADAERAPLPQVSPPVKPSIK